ncbi:MAG: hypothetical protein IJY37_06015 [Clostridia bacterium]|nr:hypothetical protein [Clostridia bacterium]
MKFKKAVSFAVAAAMSAMLLTSCGEESEIPDGMQLVDNEFVNYTFYVPDDWTPDTTIDGFLSAKANDNTNVSVQTMTWSNQYGSRELDKYFREDYFKKLESTFKDIMLLEEECSIENQTVGVQKNSAVKYVYTVGSDDATYKIVQYFSYNAGYLYIITYTGKISDKVNGEEKAVEYFEDHLEELSSIIDNFVF